MTWARAAMVGLGLTLSAPAWAVCWFFCADPPGRPAAGPGSTDAYVSAGATEFVFGDGRAGTRAWVYVPDTLKHGTTAPVVVFLHGFMLLAPDIYQAHIDHLTRQGVIVVFPQYNLGGLAGLLSDTDQEAMIGRAVAASRRAFRLLGPAASPSEVYLYGHSLGGQLAVAWEAYGGPPVAGMVLANPSLDPTAAIPWFVQVFVDFQELDWQTGAAGVDVPVTVLTGDRDTLARPAEATDLYDRLTGAPAREVWQLTTDDHGAPTLMADHMAAIQDDGIMPSFLMQLLGGDGEADATDWRFYAAALDAMLRGEAFAPDLGAWSDGVPVDPPVRLRP